MSPVSGRAQETGVVMKGTGGVWQVRTGKGEILDASLRGRLKKERNDILKLAVGDDVVVERDADASWAISEILPRRSQLARRLPGEGNDLHARVVINKIELVDRGEPEKRFNDYARAGYPLHFTSVKQRVGLDELHEALAGRTSVLSGPSGVGKSSLLNSMYPGLNLRVGEISESVNKGRHTTVGAVLHPLPDAGYVVDTPGLREVGMWGMPSEDLDKCFPELRPYVGKCRFNDCTHFGEPGCAVIAAVDSGEVSRERFESYAKLRRELGDSEKRMVDYSATARTKKRR